MTETSKKQDIALADERFWLDYGTRVIDSSHVRLEEGACRVATAMAWFWGAYSAVALAAALTQGPFARCGDRLLIAAPATLLFAAYAVATWASLPIRTKFDPRQPLQVKRAYDQVEKTRAARLGVALALGAVGAVAVGSVVFITLATSVAPNEGVVIQLSDDGKKILIGGTIADSANAVARLDVTRGPSSDAVGHADKDGNLNMALPIHGQRPYIARVTWTSAGQTYSVERKISE